ncbi:MAG: FliG C-terminal domain-containing protein [Candidatus Electryonea clarkiae]|nr:FliG C-terminal domain-containing protein [Candidatus Electryonea clarkiae]MDP8286050.1 FliG C-terminal domain-containing protein [Candidatus Electryonea clarkiae]
MLSALINPGILFRPGKTLLLVSLFFFSVSVHAQSDQDNNSENVEGPPAQIAGELELEKLVSERIENMLQPLVGPIVVMVDLKLTKLPVELEGFTYSQRQSLPGLPVSISENVRELDGSGWNYKEIQGISIRVFVSENLLEEDINRINELIPLWINLNYSRGDQIIVEPVPFVNPPLTLVQFLYSWRGIAIAAGSLAALAILVAFFFVMMSGTPRIKQAEVMPQSDSTIGGPLSGQAMAEAIGTAIQTVSGGASASHSATNNEGDNDFPQPLFGGENMDMTLSLPGGELPIRMIRGRDDRSGVSATLSQVRELNPPALQSMLHDAEPEFIAFVLQIAKPGSASAILGSLDSAVRRTVLSKWDIINSAEPGELQQILEELKQRVSKIITGMPAVDDLSERIAELINNVAEQEGKAIFVDLAATNEQLAHGVREKIFFISDIPSIEPMTLKKVVMGMPRASVATLVKVASEEVQDAFYTALSQRAATMVKEEADMMSEVPHDEVRMAKRKFMDMLKHFHEN